MIATSVQDANRAVAGSVKYRATRAGTRAFIYITCSKWETDDLHAITAAKPESQYIQVEKDVLAYGYEKFPGCICWRPALAGTDCKPFIAVCKMHWADTHWAQRDYLSVHLQTYDLQTE